MKKKFWLLLLKIAAALCVLILLLQVLLSLAGDHYADQWLQNNIHSSDSLYTLQYDNLDIGLLGRSVTFHNLRFQTDTTALSDTLAAGPTLINATVKKAAVKGISLWGYFMHHTLSVNAITLTEPILTITPGHSKRKHQPFASVDSSIYAAISKKVDALSIRHVAIHKGQFLIKKHGVPGDSSLWATNIGLNLDDMRVDSASARSNRMFITDRLNIHVRQFGQHLDGKFYTLSARNFSLSSAQQTLSVDSIQLKPRFQKYEFSRQRGYETDRITLNISHIRFRDIDLDQSINHRHLYAQKGEIVEPRIQVFHDKSMPAGPPHKKAPLPQTIFKNLHKKIKIDTLSIKDGFLSYAEQKAELNNPGIIHFDDITATASGISNYEEDLTNKHEAIINVHAMVMGKGPLRVKFTFPMGSNNGQHYIKGTLGSMMAPAFNEVTENVALARFTNGIVHRVDFSMHANKYGAYGWLTADYEHLSVDMLKIKAHHAQGKEAIKSFIANTFVVRKNNHVPPLGKAAIRFKRTAPKSIFNLWWKGLLSGLKEQIDVF